MRRAILSYGAIVLALAACTSAAPTEPDGHIVFDNQSSKAITEAGFSTCDDMSGFGPNLLKSNLMPGTSASFGAKAGCYDLQVVFVGGQDLQSWNVQLAKGQTKTWTIH